MSREIKFRGWHKGQNEMFYPVGTIGRDGYAGLYPSQIFEKFNGHELMQYTGQKDEDGTEIYEGDILRCLDEITTVFFNDSKACFDTEFLGGDCEPLVENGRGTECFRIIGNIYQNPELLTHDQD